MAQRSLYPALAVGTAVVSVAAIAVYLLTGGPTSSRSTKSEKNDGKPTTLFMPDAPIDPVLNASPLPPRRVYGNGVYMQPSPHRQKMNLSFCPADELIEFDEKYHDDMKARQETIATEPNEVLHARPPAPYDSNVDLKLLEEANRELLEHVLDYLLFKFPSSFEWVELGGTRLFQNNLLDQQWDLGPGGADWARPLYVMGHLTQADWVLVMPGNEPPDPELDGDAPEYRFVSAVNVFSFPGVIQRERIGTLFTTVHGPVPKYNSQLRKGMNKFFNSGLRTGKPVNRYNWALTTDPRMYRKDFQADRQKKFSQSTDSPLTASNLADRVFYRTERQTLMRLPRTGAVAFEIKSTMHTLREAVEKEGQKFVQGLNRALRGLDDEVKSYKGLSKDVYELVLAYLEGMSSEGKDIRPELQVED